MSGSCGGKPREGELKLTFQAGLALAQRLLRQCTHWVPTMRGCGGAAPPTPYNTNLSVVVDKGQAWGAERAGLLLSSRSTYWIPASNDDNDHKLRQCSNTL